MIIYLEYLIFTLLNNQNIYLCGQKSVKPLDSITQVNIYGT